MKSVPCGCAFVLLACSVMSKLVQSEVSLKSEVQYPSVKQIILTSPNFDTQKYKTEWNSFNSLRINMRVDVTPPVPIHLEHFL